MDTTYFGRDFGVLVFKHPAGQHLYWKFVKYETVSDYLDGIYHLREQGVCIKGVVCDGRKGLLKALSEYPVQMCQFHQVAIVTRYLTRKPKHQASIEFKQLIHLKPRIDKESFLGALDQWREKWGSVINERAVNPETG